MSKKVGVLDLGSNSLRLLVCRVDEKKVIRPLRQELVESRLGEGLQPGGKLSPEARQRTFKGISSLLRVLTEEEVQYGIVVATSAVRDASNGAEFLGEVAAISPYPVRLLEEKEEARYGFLGAVNALQLSGPQNKQREKLLTCDLGGRSTEFSWEEKGMFRFASIPFGAVTLQEKYLFHSPVDGAVKLKELVKIEMQEHLEEDLTVLSGKSIVGLGGTVTTLALLDQGLKEYRLEYCHGYLISRERVAWWKNYLLMSSMEERLRLLPFAPQRVDIIQGGTAALLAVMEFLEKDEMTVSCEGLLYGVAAEL